MIKRDIELSKANTKTTNYDKAYAITEYAIKNYRYYKGDNRLEQRHFNSLTKYGHAVCEGATIYLLEALRQLKVPAYPIIVDNYTHIVVRVFNEDGTYTQFDPTPFIGGWSKNSLLPVKYVVTDKYDNYDAPFEGYEDIAKFIAEYFFD